MIFSSLIFIFAFLPIFLTLYYLVPEKYRNWIIVLGGCFFYAWGAPRFVFILLFTIAINYWLSKVIFTCQNLIRKKWLLIFSILIDLGLLAYFKYSNFFVNELNIVLDLFNLPAMPWKTVILPIGISFTVFQEISYIIETYRGHIKPARSLIDFTAYLMLFPHVIAGPIVRYVDIGLQLEKRIYNANNFIYGIQRFSLGLAKKTLIANNLAPIADNIFKLHETNIISSPLAWLGIITYALQIYFDFSGYSDMAIGLAKMLGFEFKENFNHPYIAQNITDFWRRWHISLSTWMREYLYIPLGGNRVSTAKMYLNLWIVFLISGLWHGANWNFIFWGAYHGFLLVLDKIFWLKFSAKIPIALNIFLTFILINIGWIFFRLENFTDAWNFLINLFNLTNLSLNWPEIFNRRSVFILSLALFISFFPASRNFILLKNYFAQKNTLMTFAGFILFFLSILSLINAQFNPFIYFRF